MGWCLDLLAEELTDPGGAPINLSRGEFAMLCAFVEHARRVLSRKQLLNAVGLGEKGISDRVIDVRISRLRRKLKSDEIIRTIPGAGYMFMPPVKPV